MTEILAIPTQIIDTVTKAKPAVRVSRRRCETAQQRYYRHLSLYQRRSDWFGRTIAEQLRQDGPPPPEPGDCLMGRLVHTRLRRNRRG